MAGGEWVGRSGWEGQEGGEEWLEGKEGGEEWLEGNGWGGVGGRGREEWIKREMRNCPKQTLIGTRIR